MMALEERGDAPYVYESHPWKYVLYPVFFFITLFTQIVYLNMIIAFMADTFERMNESKSKLALQQQMRIMATSRMIFGKLTDLTDDAKRFLYIVETVNREEEDQKALEIDEEEWRGKIHKIDQNMKHVIRELEGRQDQKIEEIKAQNNDLNNTLKKQLEE